MKQKVPSKAALFCAALVWMTACAVSPSPDPRGPRANDPGYPIVLTDDSAKRDAALAMWLNFTRAQGIPSAPAPEFQPVTATVKSIPPLPTTPLYLPEVGEGLPMTEEETREALRRFLAKAGLLLCGERHQLSLVERVDLANGMKEARYRQHPFRYPLRGGFGKVIIGFAPDRRVLQLTSTCLPEIERFQRTLAGFGPPLSADKAFQSIAGRSLSYIDAGGNTQTYTLSENDKINARELVIYPRPLSGDPAVLEIHLAWEFNFGGTGLRTVYLDAFTGEVLATGHVPTGS